MNTTSATVMTTKINNDTKATTNMLNTWLIQLTNNERVIFFILYLLIFSLSMVANIATLFTTFYRKIRLIQKTLIISLAISDIVVCVFFGVTNMVNFSHPMTDFILGAFMCSFIPYMQIVGSIANSVTMTAIALDRYRNIVHPLNKQWDPNIWICIAIFLTIWTISAGVSYPMYTLTEHYPITVHFLNPNKHPPLLPQTVDLYLCATKNKPTHFLFYSIMFALIFIPLMVLFLWLYYKIAQLIWRRRKPVTAKPYNNNNSVTMETSTDSKPPSSSVKQSPINVHIDRRVKNVVKTSKLHMERKIRTFKIIIVIMIVFFVCRMPHWIFTLMRFAMVLSGPKYWILSTSLSLLLIINTTLNPFLYSFLNQTIMYFDKFFMSIGDFISKICCCCCSNNEFDGFEKDNPFSPELYEQRPSQTSSIVPRGPYMDNINAAKQNNVTFHDVAIIDLNPKENVLQNLNCNTY